MNLAMAAHIKFGDFSIRRIHSVTIKKRVSEISQVATIVLPRRVTELRDKEIKTFIKRNDPVTISLGYNGEMIEEFRGTVTSVGAGIPVEIVCRDEMYLIQQAQYSKSFEDCHVPTLLRELIPQSIEVDALDVTIGPQAFKKVTVGEVLKYLSDEFSLYTFIKNGVVYCGKRFNSDPTIHTYVIEELVKEDSLTYKDADEIRIKVEATSVQPNGERFTVTVGDDDGEIRKLSYFAIASEAELRKLALLDLDKFKYTGYEGTLTGYGSPAADFADFAKVVSRQFPERNTTVLIEEMEIKFDASPEYSRKLTLDGAI
jgi:hypothetical protein